MSEAGDKTFTLDELEGDTPNVWDAVQPARETEKTRQEEDAGYQARLDQLLSGDDDEDDTTDLLQRLSTVDAAEPSDNGGEDDDEDFVYTGADAPPTAAYDVRMAKLLGDDAPEVDELPAPSDNGSNSLHIPSRVEARPLLVRGESIASSTASSSRFASIANGAERYFGRSHPVKRPSYVHPSVSRLRSSVAAAPPRPRLSSSSTILSTQSRPAHLTHDSFHGSEFSHHTDHTHQSHNGVARTLGPPASELRMSSAGASSASRPPSPLSDANREVFRWGKLRSISNFFFGSEAKSTGRPAVMVAASLICVGTESGRSFVFDARQKLSKECRAEGDGLDAAGSVTALALSADETFLAIGHQYGHIYLYDLKRPNVLLAQPVRSVAPLPSADRASSGTAEGHLEGSSILHIGFIGARHTQIVSTDRDGLAFVHSLGKVLFVEANDVRRILGHYPSEQAQRRPHRLGNRAKAGNRVTTSILAMASLPLSTHSAGHKSDIFQVIVLLTPVKLVIVGLKPEPKTWYRQLRQVQEGATQTSTQYCGCVALRPSMNGSTKESEKSPVMDTQGRMDSQDPLLVYSWSNQLCFLRIGTQNLQSQDKEKTGKGDEKPNREAMLTFWEAGKIEVEHGNVMALRFLNVNQLLVVTSDGISVYDVASLELLDHANIGKDDVGSCMVFQSQVPIVTPSAFEGGNNFTPSFDVHRNKVYFMRRNIFSVGSLVTWADRILSLVESGDFLGAIQLTEAFYRGTTNGSNLGLPRIKVERQVVIGARLQQLITASIAYAFSEERLKDPRLQGKGVDQTQLFEQLISTIASACKTMQDFTLLFQDVFDLFEEHGIENLFYDKVTEEILSRDIQDVPPRVNQRLIGRLDQLRQYDTVERLLWHINPVFLDIDQVTRICKTHSLFDAMANVFNLALNDYLTPLVDLLSIIRNIAGQKSASQTQDASSAEEDENHLNQAYQIFPYLSHLLCGLSHPSQKELPPKQAIKARTDLYQFIFSGQSVMWQGKLLLTNQTESQKSAATPEPTFPYLRLLIRFDAESMLHTLDLSFEDSFLNGSRATITRQKISSSLIDLLQAQDLAPSDLTFIRIFIARNHPKYPQFISLSRSTIRSIIIGLASDLDSTTKEDRQLAVESLLSSASLDVDRELVQMFEDAQFYRLLSDIFLRQRKWAKVIRLTLQDPQLEAGQKLWNIESLLSNAESSQLGTFDDLTTSVADALPQLLQVNVADSAVLIDRYLPSLHDQALQLMRASDTSRELAYLKVLVEQPDTFGSSVPNKIPSPQLSDSGRLRYMELICARDTSHLLPMLESAPPGYWDLNGLEVLYESEGAYDAMFWCMDKRGDLDAVFSRMEGVMAKLSTRAIRSFKSVEEEPDGPRQTVDNIIASVKLLVQILSNSSLKSAQNNAANQEDTWFRLIQSQISSIQNLSHIAVSPDKVSRFEPPDQLSSQIPRLRRQVQETFQVAVQQFTHRNLSFPNLFGRMVDESSKTSAYGQTTFADFKLVLDVMLDSYRSEEDILLQARKLTDEDLFDLVSRSTALRQVGRRMQLP